MLCRPAARRLPRFGPPASATASPVLRVHVPRCTQPNSDEANARIEHDAVLTRIVTSMMKDDAMLFKQFMDNEDFKRWMTDTVFEHACEQEQTP